MAGMMPTPASANSPAAFTILDVDQNAYLFVGGIFGTVKVFVSVQDDVEKVSVFCFPHYYFSLFPSLLESRSSKNINIHRLHGGDFLGW